MILVFAIRAALAKGSIVEQDHAAEGSHIFRPATLVGGEWIEAEGRAATAKFRDNGQARVCANRINMRHALYDAFADKLAAVKLRGG